MRPALRRLWLQIHRYTALGIGWLLAFAALLGALLTVAKPLDRALHPELFTRPAASEPATASLEAIRTQLRRELGEGASFTMRPPRTSADTLWVYVAGPWDGIVFLDPASGRELGRRGEHEGFYNLLFELHSALLLGDTGKAVLTTAAGVYLLLLVTGLVLWWPVRWPPSFRIRWGRPALRAVFDLHSIGGAVLGLLIAVSVVTGAYMAWPPLRPWVSSLFGEKPVAAPRVTPQPAPAAGVPTLDALVARAQALFPQGMVGYVQVPAKASQPVRVRFKLPEDPHPNGLTSVWLHPATGEVLGTVRFDRLDAGHRAVSVIYPLHTGALGGPLHTVVTGLLGAGLAALGGTGLWLWWKRRRPQVQAAARQRAASLGRP